MLPSFLRALIIGLSIAAPVGPIGILCIRRALAEGWLVGLVTGLGAATADAIYGAIAGFGLTFISMFLVNQAGWLRLIGGLFLCYLGIKTMRSKPTKAAATVERSGKGLFAAYSSTVFLTLTNPATIISFVAVFAGLGLATNQADYASAAVLVMGVFLGSALWWLMLSSSVSLFRAHFNPNRLKWLNRISGLILLVFGIIALSPT
ncbi:LysE family transporter [Leptolyngbya sp. NK1-12]|uniref:LysE family transporter n=1 Tax=Leptolyngbya sp. NK1-12 TaxID=2547451 RepID=A0AA97AJR9_9CYAN|nr:LysE family transporter [Leptolyngbya sp. NK1-12]